MDENDNLLIPNLQNESEEIAEISLRPKTLDEYIGQTKVKENMKENNIIQIMNLEEKFQKLEKIKKLLQR